MNNLSKNVVSPYQTKGNQTKGRKTKQRVTKQRVISGAQIKLKATGCSVVSHVPLAPGYPHRTTVSTESGVRLVGTSTALAPPQLVGRTELRGRESSGQCGVGVGWC